MALYLGTELVQLYLKDKPMCLNIYSPTGQLPEESIRLLSSDNYILKDSNDVYLIPKEAK